MIIDLEKCIGCHACAVACKAEWDVPTNEGRNWVKRLGPSQTPEGLASTYYPGLCNHCDSPTCVEACPADPVQMEFTDRLSGKTTIMEVAATWKDLFDGTVQIDKERCLGCGACAEACPYGARYVNPDLGEDGKADKCSFCVERTAIGLEPACVQTCLAGARIFGDLHDPHSKVAEYVKKGAIKLESDAVKIGPNVRYYGKKRDLSLLTSTCTPQSMPQASLRRIFLARMLKPLAKEAKRNPLLHLLG
ncbi:MAG: 4Fe-4S dicluster domain-containing protein [Proteobacteria bacterium]|nr:4Fe-4S dicluster domain-containing protein [Pseudomonadota bacterium]MBU1687204.1 4Fe-4S dicluster domain-containing protein [Pseudomonadota bacterium]